MLGHLAKKKKRVPNCYFLFYLELSVIYNIFLLLLFLLLTPVTYNNTTTGLSRGLKYFLMTITEDILTTWLFKLGNISFTIKKN